MKQKQQKYDLLIRFNNQGISRVIMLFVVLLSAASLFLLPSLRFDYQFEHFFPSGDKDIAFYHDFTKRFETDNDFLLLGIRSEQGVFDSVFLHKVSLLTDSLEQLAHIRYLLALNREKTTIIGPLGPIQIPFIHAEKPGLYVNDSIRIFHAGYLIGSLISEDAKSIAIYLKTESALPKEQNDSLLFRMESIIASFGFAESHLAGKIKGQYYFIHRMKYEMGLFIGAALIMLMLFLYFTFKTIRGILLPVSVVLISSAWVIALIVLLGKSISLMTTLLPTILFVVGVSAVIHLLEKLIEELHKGKGKFKALRTTYKIVGKASILTCLTTAIGFLSLTSSRIRPTSEFGIFTAIGVGLVLLLIFTWLPALISLDKGFDKITLRLKRSFWDRMLRSLFPWILKRRGWVVFTALLLTLLAGAGILHLKIDNSFLDDYSENEERTRDYLFFEKEFSGFRSFELAVWCKANIRSGLWNMRLLQDMEKIERYLKEDYGCGFLISPVTFVKEANRARHGGDQNWYRLPETEPKLMGLMPTIRKFSSSAFGRKFITNDAQQGRISGKVQDLGGNTFKALNKQLNNYICSSVDTSLMGYQITGMGSMIDKNNEYITYNMLKGLLLAFVAVALLMALLYRSAGMIIIALIPNLLPLIIIAGLMGFTGIDLKISTSIIFTIAFGIAVDDTIHFLTRMKIELEEGRSKLYALKRTFLSTGRAMIITTFILCSGFICLLFSEISSTFYIGLLVGITLFLALICDLFLLPVLLLYKSNNA